MAGVRIAAPADLAKQRGVWCELRSQSTHSQAHATALAAEEYPNL